MTTDVEDVTALTIAWLERVVIGLNLCPFAKAIHTKDQIRYVVSDRLKSDSLLEDLKRELKLLIETAPEQVESTLLIFSNALIEFVSYNHFLDLCNLVLEEMALVGVVQIASFHPKYQFADTVDDDVTNYTNRSPFPMLHLLREESVTRAVEAFPNGDGIYERNIATMKAMGKAKMDVLINEAKPLLRQH